jgi:hypothetical protein
MLLCRSDAATEAEFEVIGDSGGSSAPGGIIP